MAEGSASRGRVSSVSSDHSVDPNDKYSVFRAVDQPEVTSIAVTPSMDKNDRFGGFQSGDQSAMKTEPPPGEVAFFQGGVNQQISGWNKTEVSSAGGHFQSAANQSFMPNKVYNTSSKTKKTNQHPVGIVNNVIFNLNYLFVLVVCSALLIFVL